MLESHSASQSRTSGLSTLQILPSTVSLAKQPEPRVPVKAKLGSAVLWTTRLWQQVHPRCPHICITWPLPACTIQDEEDCRCSQEHPSYPGCRIPGISKSVVPLASSFAVHNLHKWQPCCESLPRMMISSHLWNKWLWHPCYRWGTVHKRDAIVGWERIQRVEQNLHPYLWLPCRVQWFCMVALHANRMGNDGSRRSCAMGTGVYRLHEVEHDPNPNRPENLS